MTKEDLIRLSAYLDGRGCISISKQSKRASRYNCKLSFSTTSPLIKDWMMLKMKSFNPNINRGKSVRFLKLYKITVDKRKYLIRLLKEIEPYVLVKHRQVALALSYLKHMEKIVLLKNHPSDGLTQYDIEVRESYHTNMSYLNKNTL